DTLEAAVSRLIQETRQPPQPVRRGADLTQAVRDRMAFWGVLAKSQHRPADVRYPARRVEVPLSRDELDAAIDALLSNVSPHPREGTPSSAPRRTTAHASPWWSFMVEAEGPANRPQPRRAGGKPGGTGLGLDIVRRTAAHAGGTAEIGRGAAGG